MEQESTTSFRKKANNEKYFLITPLGTMVTADRKGLRLIQKTIGGKLMLRPEYEKKK
jgi:hypothetical protein